MNEESNKIASNTFTQIIGRIIVVILALATTKLITTYLGPAGTGVYTTIIAFLSFIIVIADFGLFSVAVREISKDQNNYKKILSNVFFIRLITAILATLLAIVIVFLTNYSQEIKTGTLVAALFPIFNLTSSVYDMLFQAKLEMQKVAIAEVLSKIIALVSIFIAVFFHLGIYAILGAVSLAALSSFVIKFWLSKNELPLKLSCDKIILSNILKMSLPLGVVFIVNNLYFKIDSLMLFYYKGAADAGIYSVAYRVLETSLFAGAYLSNSLKPLLSVSIENDQKKTEKTINTAIVFLLFMAIPIAIICISFSREIILFLSNSEFLGGAKAMVILGFATIFIYMSGIFGEIMIARDMRKTMLKVSGFILIFNIALNIILIPRYSYIGAATSTLVSEILLLTIGYIVTKKVTPLSIDVKRISKLILIGLFASLIGYFLKRFSIYFIINIVIISAFYVLFSYYFDAIPKTIVNNYLVSIRNKWKK